jgi:hypothetical protein
MSNNNHNVKIYEAQIVIKKSLFKTEIYTTFIIADKNKTLTKIKEKIYNISKEIKYIIESSAIHLNACKNFEQTKIITMIGDD